MFKNVIDKAMGLKDNVDVAQTVDLSLHASDSAIDTGHSKASEVFDTHWPKVETFIIESVLPLASDGLADDETLRTLFDKAFAMLPIHLRLILPKSLFIEMAMSRREPLLHRIQEIRARGKP